MPSTVRLLDVTDVEWLRFTHGRPDLLPFHLPEWTATLTDAYGFEPHVLAVAGADGAVRAGVPLMEVRDPLRGRRWKALPFTDRCPPLVDDPADARLLADGLVAAAAERRVGAVEVRAPLAGLPSAAVATMQLLDLSPGPEALERGFTSATRRNTRRARREGVVVRRAQTEADLVETYYRLHLRTRWRLGVPVQPRRFFRALWRQMLEPGHGSLVLAFARDTPIAGAVFLRAGTTLVYKYGASDETAWNLRANNALFADVILDAAQRGFAQLDFGRSDFASQGLRAFKKGWGAVEEPLVHSGLTAAADPGPRRSEELLARLINRTPPMVCRALGETLYRYAA